MVKRKIYNRVISFFIENKPSWINKFVKDLVFRFGFIPEIISNRKYFSEWEKKGTHISSTHFYHPIPNLSQLGDDFWDKEFSMKGVKINLSFQLELLLEFRDKFAMEFNALPIHKSEVKETWEYFVQNGNFTSVDGEILYCFVRKFMPTRIIEIGSGYSTFLISKAISVNIERDKSYEINLTCVEPYPRDFFKTSIPFLSELIEKPIQEIDLALFKSLKENDILFIDSTHVFKYGSDVETEVFEILPTLEKGVIIHFHDIFWPKNYPEKWIKEHGWFWNEQHFLQAFLMFNDSFEIIWSSSLIHKYNTIELADIIKSYSKIENPGSLWIRKIK